MGLEDKKYRKIILKIIAILIVVVVLFGISYALFQVTLHGRKRTRLGAANISLKLTDKDDLEETDGYAIDLESAYPMPDSDGIKGTTYEFHLVNDGSVGAIYQLYLDDILLEDGEERIDDSDLRYSLEINSDPMVIGSLSDLGVNPNRNLTAGTIRQGETVVFKLHLWIDINADNSIIGKVFSGQIRVEGSQYLGHSNPDILAVYHYQESGTTTDNGDGTYTYNPGDNDCITGEEATCQIDECYKSYIQGTCPPGTIVKYQINDNDYKYFYVLHDDGKSMTLQDRINTIATGQTVWDNSGNKESGPITMLEALDATVDKWKNVNTISYTMGETQFIRTKDVITNNPYTYCSESGESILCNKNLYTMERNNVKVRMITAQEAYEVGCRYLKTNSCPIWMFNYLNKSKTYGGTNNRGSGTDGYFTMNASYSINAVRPCTIQPLGYIANSNANNDNSTYARGARAVVEINK